MDDSYDIEVFFDGACPLCSKEIEFLRKRDQDYRIVFTDIAAPWFDPKAIGRTQSELMERIQARLPDGTWIEGVEVFRRLYGIVGFRGLVSLTRNRPVAAILDFAYERFAKNRLRLTGRCDDVVCAVPTRNEVSAR
ncbi:MAG: DUF393 domain-containing protein [Sandaracinaceae bacterium]|jgi:predicted DCC family thiol-disulfide oxidoreductase YuxK|nr:DUF393 domain-containing protein [Sandaracinaceae bacterium]